VTDEFWGAPSSKKKKGKKGKKSGQSTPLVTEEAQEPITAVEPEVQDKDLAVSQEPKAPDNEVLDASQTTEAQPAGQERQKVRSRDRADCR
jgi:hypothetical protein